MFQRFFELGFIASAYLVTYTKLMSSAKTTPPDICGHTYLGTSFPEWLLLGKVLK